MSEEVCRYCRFGERTERVHKTSGLDLFLCKRYPPAIIVGETGMQLEYSAWPTVTQYSWCGEFAPKHPPHWTDPEHKELFE